MSSTNVNQSGFINIAIELINKKYEKKQKRDIWEDSKWRHIAELENDDVGGVGEEIINNLCSLSLINADIDGLTPFNISNAE